VQEGNSASSGAREVAKYSSVTWWLFLLSGGFFCSTLLGAYVGFVTLGKLVVPCFHEAVGCY
jgi:hypothetical protein